ncbi:MAG: tetratricopeptide repeat protein [Bacteroidota bacterium]
MSKNTMLTIFFLSSALYISCNEEEQRVEVGQNGLIEIREGFSTNHADYERALKYIRENKPQEAIKVYKKLCRIEDDSLRTGAYMGLGSAYLFAGEYQNAISCYNKSIKLDSTNVESYVGLGSAYFTLKDYEKAISCYQEAKKINPNNSNSYWGLAIAYNGIGRMDSAKANGKKFILLEPNSKYNNLIRDIINK